MRKLLANIILILITGGAWLIFLMIYGLVNVATGGSKWK